MEKKIKLGQTNRLTVVKAVDFGMYLDGGEAGEILLPTRYVPRECKPGDELEVFIYLDNEERLVATTEKPLARVGDFACLRVAWVNKFGAFLHWGLMKDLFVPFREQKMRMQQDRSYIVHVHVDEETYRIVASAKVEHYLSDEQPAYHPDDEVEGLVWQKTDLGFKVIVDNRFAGLLYDSEVFASLHTGDRLRMYVRQVRPDGKIDLALRPRGQAAVEGFAEVLLRHLKTNAGTTPLCDKSPAEEIYSVFGVSKKVFKKAVGDLYKKRLIELTDSGLKLL
ncbi:MAG: S1-like domain-containing RNA-binding protein [Clostridium sp.]|nr:S1-like domain-containing RNA-binding protein [Clostridium sp.]